MCRILMHVSRLEEVNSKTSVTCRVFHQHPSLFLHEKNTSFVYKTAV